MKLDSDLIVHISRLARLNLNDAELQEFLPQLREILDSFEKISKVDTRNIEPSYHPVKIRGALREDDVGACLSQEAALKNTLSKDNYFKGPKVK